MTGFIIVTLVYVIGITITVRDHRKKFPFFGKNRIDYLSEKGYVCLSVAGYAFINFSATCIVNFIPESVINIYQKLWTNTGIIEETIDTAIGQIDWKSFVLIGLLAPITEELVLRGVVFKKMRTKYSVILSVFLTSALGGILHITIQQCVHAFFTGIVLALIVEKYDDIRLPVVLHILNNILAVCGATYEINDNIVVTAIIASGFMGTIFITLFMIHSPCVKVAES